MSAQAAQAGEPTFEARLEALRARGVNAWDPGGLRVCETLTARAATEESNARERLLERADAHLSRLETRFSQAEDRARVITLRLGEQGWDENGDVAKAFERGDFVAVARAAQRHPDAMSPARKAAQDKASERLRETVTAQGLSSPPEELGIGDEVREEHGLLEMAERLYRDAAAEATLHAVVASASEPPPEFAGRYHAETTAGDAIRHMDDLGRDYLRAQIARLEAFGALQALVAELPEPTLKVKRRRRKKKA